MKKIVAILLAITLMSALFIVPAHAQEPEVLPRGPVVGCVKCHEPMSFSDPQSYSYSTTVNYCDYESHSHYHTIYRQNAIYTVCNNCGYRELYSSGSYYRTYCPYRGYFY